MKVKRSRLISQIAALFVLSCGVSPARAGHVEQIGVQGISVGPGGKDATGFYGGDGGGPACGSLPCFLITVEGNTVILRDPCLPSGCMAPDPRIRVELLDCDGNVSQSQTKSVPRPDCAGAPPGVPPPNPFTVTFSFEVCGRAPKSVRVTEIRSEGKQEPDGSCSQKLTEDASQELNPGLPPLDGSLTKAQLDCLACSPKEQPSRGRVIWYKAERLLYTLPLNDTSAAGFGETVNGRFVVPSAGQLVMEVRNQAAAVDVWSGLTATGTGWQTPNGRNGTLIGAERTVFWTVEPAAGTAYEFNVRGYRGAAPEFDVLFHWYRWDDGSCCIQHEVESLWVQVLPLPCKFEGKDPVTPEMRHAATGADGHHEIRIPCCPRCDDGQACTSGNLSGWFVTWTRDAGAQTAAIGQVLDGHAQGWRFDSNSNTLWSPGPDRLGYEFEQNP